VRNGVLEDVYFDYAYAPVPDDDGTVNSVMVFAVDVTQKVLARHEVEHALTEAREANAVKDDFMALLGHELRNPLAPIMTAIDLMKLREYKDVEREAAIVLRQTLHLARLVEDLLDVSRIVQGKFELKRKVIDLSDVILKGVELASPLFEQKRHRLEVEVPRGIFVDGDPVRLAQVVSNLLVNAAKYTSDGGNIVLAARRDGEEVAITVKDNGIGIAPETLPHIFERFVQERQGIERARGGLGLGLTIVKSLVEQHGGSITAHSDGRDRGSTFEVRLPLQEQTRRTSAQPTPAPLVRVPRRVLIVDDNEDAARMLADAVSALGHDTRVAHDGPSALTAVQGFTPEVALLDIGLPVMDGYELGRQLREEQRLKGLRLVAITGYGQPSDSLRSHDSGFDAHLVKPVNFAGLATLIDDLLPDAP
jgi:CheY-like chemotaxis protein